MIRKIAFYGKVALDNSPLNKILQQLWHIIMEKMFSFMAVTPKADCARLVLGGVPQNTIMGYSKEASIYQIGQKIN